MSTSPWEKPWFVGGGVNHSEELARLIAYVATDGGEGIVGPDDLKVTATGTGQVAIAPGACAIINRASGALYESYAARNPASHQVAIPGTTASGTRSDLIIARIEDPFETGEPWAVPPAGELQTRGYVRTAVISNVPNTTVSLDDLSGHRYTAIPLARIDLPVSTSVVAQSHIVDLREMYRPTVEPGLSEIITPSTSMVLTSAGYTRWISNADRAVRVPPWATHAKVRVLVGGVRYGVSGNTATSVLGNLRVMLGTLAGTATQYSLDADAGVDTATLMFGTPRLAIPKAQRGKTLTLSLQGMKSSGNTSISADSRSLVSVDLDWIKVPE